MPDPGASGGGTRRARRKRLWWVAGAVAVLFAAALAWFQPQKLLYSDRVDEALPAPVAAEPGAPATGSPAEAAAAPVELAAGSFVSREHRTTGVARVLRLSDGRVIVRFEGFSTSNGPVLVVWLSTNSARGDSSAFSDGYVDLGPLKGNIGDQNYAVPSDVDATAYTSVVVWCDRFDVPFGAADLHRQR